MKKSRLVVYVAVVCVALAGISSVVLAKVGRPAPPPPVLCGCLCPDGSFTTTHAPDANSCDAACAVACQNSSEY
jgi:hypothetical protein